MVAPIAMDVRPITTPHLDLDHLPLIDKDFQIIDTNAYEVLLKLHYLSRDRYLNHSDDICLWESNLPKYQFPQVHVFPEIIPITFLAKELLCSLTKIFFSPSQLNQSMICYNSN